jgi:hypothetical protein
VTRTLLLTTALAAGLALAGCNKNPEPPTTQTEAGATGDVVTASANPTVGGAEMLPTKTIVENASASPIHKQLVAALKQADLAETLSGTGPFHGVRADRRGLCPDPCGAARRLDAAGAEDGACGHP